MDFEIDHRALVVARLCGVRPREVVGALWSFWRHLADHRRIQRILETAQGKPVLTLTTEEVLRTLKAADASDLSIEALTEGGFLEPWNRERNEPSDDSETPQAYRVRGASRIFEAFEAKERE